MRKLNDALTSLMLFLVAFSAPAVAQPAVTTITVMELYTPQAAQAYGGVEGIAGQRGAIAGAVAQLNRDLSGSGVTDIIIQLVRVEQMTFPSLDKWALLSALRTDPRVAQLRDLYGADLVGLWTDGADGAIAFQPNVSAPDPSLGFAVFGFGGDPLFVYSHERGHNFGMQHEDLPTTWDPYAFARGYCGSQVRDLMATACAAPTTARAFSNPATTWGGHPIGDSTHDNVRILRLTAPTIAIYQ